MITPLIILAILITPLLLEWLLSHRQKRALQIDKAMYFGLSMAFIFFSVGHFVKTAGMVDMLPTWVHQKELLVYVTGILELMIALGLMIKRYQAQSAGIAIIVLVLFFPVNIYAAWHQVGLGGHQWGPVYLLIRTPLQMVLIGWCYQSIQYRKRGGNN